MTLLFGRVLRSLIAAAILVFPALASSGLRPAVFDPETFVLDNGMQVVVVSNHRAPVVTHMVWYKVGSADEVPGKTGLAHFFEHLMFKGTEKYPGDSFSRTVARNGGSGNAFTSHDYTAYFQTIAVDRLSLVMEMEADRMTGLILGKEDLETERKVVLEERLQRTDNNPSAILGERVSAALFMNYPYRNPVIGWEDEIRALSLDDAMAFYRRWYMPNNAVLVVAGDITADELRPLAEETYGRVRPAALPPRIRAQEPPHKAPRRIVLSDERVRQPAWSRHFLAPGYLTDISPDFGRDQVLALEVLSQILGSGIISPFYKDLVVENELAISAGTYYSPDGMGPGRFVISATPRPNVAIKDLEKAVEQALSQIAEKGISEEQVKRAKKALLSEAIYARDTLRTGAHAFGAALSVGQDVDAVETWPDKISAVSVSDVNSAMKALFDKNRSVTAVLLPKENEETAK
jgi:zinc protease